VLPSSSWSIVSETSKWILGFVVKSDLLSTFNSQNCGVTVVVETYSQPLLPGLVRIL
jgi:hypothetical protein